MRTMLGTNMNLKTWLLTVLPLGALLVGCNSAPATPETSGTPKEGGTTATPTTEKKIKVGIVYDTGGLGDKSFNDSANAGIERAKKDFGVEATIIQSKNTSDYELNVENLVTSKCDIVIAVGLGMENAVNAVAAKYPDAKIAVVDGDGKGENVRSLLFKEEQGSFLAGYVAGLMSKTGTIGFVGGMDIPLIAKFHYGYFAGARLANPKINLLPAKFTGDWNSTDKGKAAAISLYASGADVVYHAAGRAGLGVFKAAEEQGKFVIGVDSDQDYMLKGLTLTSMVKRVDEAVYSTIKDVKDGKFTGGPKMYDIAAKGVGLSEMKYTKDLIGAENLKKIEEVKAKLISGEIKAPTNKAEFDAAK